METEGHILILFSFIISIVLIYMLIYMGNRLIHWNSNKTKLPKNAVLCINCKHFKRNNIWLENACMADPPPGKTKHRISPIDGNIEYLNYPYMYVGVDARKRNKRFNCKKFKPKNKK